MSRRALIVDACSAINLLTARAWDGVFAAGGWRPVIPGQAADETLCTYDEEGVREVVDLAAMAAAGQVEIWNPVDDEVADMLRHAVRLGAGEAAGLAIARARGLPLLTDDRPARRAAAQTPAVQVVSTAELMQVWAEGRPRQEIRAALRLITEAAAFRPPPDDPLQAWWSSLIAD